jgi:hypothetical protein
LTLRQRRKELAISYDVGIQSRFAGRQEAAVQDSQLQAERGHLRTLLELTTARGNDARRRVARGLNRAEPATHRRDDDVAIWLLHPAREQMGRYALTAHGVGWTDELTTEFHPETEPLATWLAERRTVDINVEQFDWTGCEGSIAVSPRPD